MWGGRAISAAHSKGHPAIFALNEPAHCPKNMPAAGTDPGSERAFCGVLLVGEPDSGKTTLLRHLARHLAHSQGSVTVIDARRELFRKKAVQARCWMCCPGCQKACGGDGAAHLISPCDPAGRAGGMEEVAALEQGFSAGWILWPACMHRVWRKQCAVRRYRL